MSQDQRAVWEASYRSFLGSGRPFDETPSDLAIEVASLLEPGSRVLELGCGTGCDAAYFARSGFDVTAIDHAAAAVEVASSRFEALVASGQLRYVTQDIAQPLPPPNAALDAVYARLSLHYFSDERTKQIFGEIARVLKADGLLAFICKSVDDPLYGRGRRIDEDIYEDGHVRHFFSEAYALECIATGFRLESMAHIHGPLYGQESAYVKVVARRT